MPLFSKKQPEQPKNIDEALAQLEELKKSVKELSSQMEEIKAENVFDIKKIAVVRFNPFSELGSNQSFSLAILDGNACGAVITSLFTRNENRVYAKPVKNGSSEFKLSEEEKKAIDMAQKRQ